MLRIILAALLLSSCTLGVHKTGGERTYAYDSLSEYTEADLKEMAPQIVITSQKEPNWGKNEKLFDPKLPDLKRIGILVFESSVQTTRGGLAGDDLVYVSAQGKQLIAEKLLSLWEQVFQVLGKDIEYVKVGKIKASKSAKEYGNEAEKFIASKRSKLEPDDVFYLPKGKETTVHTTVIPRGLRDLSLLLVPASEMMLGPKWTEQNKHFVNEVARELKLDAILVINNDIHWTAAHKDKYTGEMIPEEVTLKIKSSILLPYAKFNERLKAIGLRDEPNVNLPYRTYETKLSFPVLLSVPPVDQKFSTIERELLTPMLKTYKDMTIMTVDQMIADLKKTF
jgi:hypothetical protein